MSKRNLVIVESPTKARTIVKFLDKNFVVKASNGHIRDLPTSAAEIPAKLKKEPWARLGVNVNSDFQALYVIPTEKKAHVKSLQDEVKNADFVYLATDEDREGESISWHLVETLQPKVPVKRLVFHEITKDAILESLSTARDIDQNLVKAQETRRIIDRLYGYEVSPLLWKKMATGLSAGRVQSVAIRLLAERERERIAFVRAQYCGVKGIFAKAAAENSVDAVLVHLGDKRVAVGKDFDPKTGKCVDPAQVVVLSPSVAAELANRIKQAGAKVKSIEEKPFVSRPSAPFVTSSLQQEGNRKLRFSAKQTMRVAQQLYENGFITYMRTDSTTLSTQAIAAARDLVGKSFGAEYLPDEPRVYKTKVKNAQEAHEAIRPAGDHFTPPEVVRSQLGEDAFKLYELIWKRTVASQMKDAKGTYVTVLLESGDATLRAVGKTIEFPGFLRAYVEGSDDPDSDLADQEKILPNLKVGEALSAEKVEPTEHETQPPPRFTEGSLIKELERLGIGRPSTWATVVETVLNRAYAFKKGTALVPTFTALAVVDLLAKHFPQLLDYEFTARLEDDLDAISRGEAENLGYLRNFYFGNGHKGLKTLIEEGGAAIDPREVCGVSIGTTADGQKLEVRIGRYGPFISNGTDRASVPDGMAPDELTMEEATKILITASRPVEALGLHPESGEPVYVKSGRFGPYVQLGDMVDGGPKPKMVSLLQNMKPEEVSLETALKLLTLPRELGANPDSGEKIVAALGRFGPYIKCGADTRSIPQGLTTPIDITLEQAVELLRQPKTRGRSTTKPTVLKELGAHPQTGKMINVLNGRYGPYVTDGETNASLPKDLTPESCTLERALSLIAEREGAPKKKKQRKKAEGSSKKTSTKKKASKVDEATA